MKHSLKATALAFGLAMLCGSLTWGCGAATNSIVQNKANQTAMAAPATAEPAKAAPATAFFTVGNDKVLATSATAPGAAHANKRDSSLNHWQLE